MIFGSLNWKKKIFSGRKHNFKIFFLVITTIHVEQSDREDMTERLGQNKWGHWGSHKAKDILDFEHFHNSPVPGPAISPVHKQLRLHLQNFFFFKRTTATMLLNSQTPPCHLLGSLGILSLFYAGVLIRTIKLASRPSFEIRRVALA